MSIELETLALAKAYTDKHVGRPTDEQTAEAVSNYLDQHPVQPYDDTEIKGEVASVMADLTELTNGWNVQFTPNVYNMRIHQDGYWNGTDDRFGVSNPIEIPTSRAFTKVVINLETINNYTGYIAFSKENIAGSSQLMGVVSKYTIESAGLHVVDIPVGAKYMWLSTKGMNSTCVTQAYILSDDMLANLDKSIFSFVEPIEDETKNGIDLTKIESFGGSTSASWEVVGENELRVYRATASTNSAILFKIDGLVENQWYYCHLNIKSVSGATPKMRFGLHNASGTQYAVTDDEPKVGEYSGYVKANANCVGAILFITAGTSTLADYVINEIMVIPTSAENVPVGYVPKTTATDYTSRVIIASDLKKYTDERTRPITNKHTTHKPRVTFIDDDGMVAFYERLLPIAREFNIPLVSAYAGDVARDMRTPTFMSQAQVKECVDAGCEIIVHGNYNLTTLSLAEAEENVLKSKRALASKGFDSNLYVYPHSGTSEEIRAMMSKYFDGAFITGSPQSPNYRTNASNNDLLGNYFIHRVSCGGYYDNPVTSGRYGSFADTSSMDYFRALIDECVANNSWLVFMTHATMMIDGQHSSSGWQPTPQIDHFERFKDIIRYIQSLEATTDIKIVNASEGFEMFGNAIQCGDYLGTEYNDNMTLHNNKGVAISKKGVVDFD